mgnify:CR=1 FL=1
MLTKIVVNILAAAAQDERVRAFVADQIARLVERLKAELLPDLIELLPTFGSGVVKAALDQLPDINLPDASELGKDVARNILDADPDLGHLSEIVDVSELLRKWLR